MTVPRPRRSVCQVCRLRGTSRDPLADQIMRDKATGEAVAVAAHLGGCSNALAARYEPIEGKSTEMDSKRGSESSGAPADSTGDTPQPPVEAPAGPEAPDTNPGPEAPAAPPEAPAGPAAPETPPADPEAPAEGAQPAEGEAGAEKVAEAAVATVAALRADVIDLSNLPKPLGISTNDVVRWVVDKSPLPESDPADVARAIALEIILAPDLDSALASREVKHAKDLLYRTLRIHGVKWQPSDFDNEGAPAYAVMDAQDAFTQERFAAICGGMNVVAALIKADLLQAWPITVQITETPTGENGSKRVFRLEKADTPAPTLDLDGQTF